MREKLLKKKEILRKGLASLLKISLWASFQFLLVQIQAPAFSVNGASTLNRLFQTINGLKRLWITTNGSINYNIVYCSI